jgi:uncharacterized protein DUF6090
MIKFFRKIRQNLLAEGKIGKYLKYAIGEIILVVVGILIALQINNWNQVRIEIKTETESLNNLVLDLEEQSDLLELYLKDESGFYEDGIYILEHYAKHKSFSLNDTLLSKLNKLAFRRTFTPINTTFEELVSTGNIGLIRNKKLKRNILKFYNELERISLVTLNNNTNLIDGLYNPVLMEQSLFVFKFNFPDATFEHLFSEFQKRQSSTLDSESLETLYSTSKNILSTPEKALNLFNVLQIRIQLAYGQISNYDKLKKEITELLNEINQEIEK